MKIDITKKKCARYLSIRKRHMALDSNDQVYGRRLKKLLKALVVRTSIETDPTIKNKLVVLTKVYGVKYFKLMFEPTTNIDRPLRWIMSIDSFTEEMCWNFFETKKSDLWRLCSGLKFPESAKLDNGCRMPGEEVFLRGLYELVSGEDQYNIATNVFGRDQSQQSRAFSFFIDHIFSTFHDLLSDNLD